MYKVQQKPYTSESQLDKRQIYFRVQLQHKVEINWNSRNHPRQVKQQASSIERW